MPGTGQWFISAVCWECSAAPITTGEISPARFSAEELALRRRMKELFRASRDSLGSRTLMKNLHEEGFKIGRYRTRRLMKAESEGQTEMQIQGDH